MCWDVLGGGEGAEGGGRERGYRAGERVLVYAEDRVVHQDVEGFFGERGELRNRLDTVEAGGSIREFLSKGDFLTEPIN